MAAAAAVMNGLCTSVNFALARLRKKYIEDNDSEDPELIAKVAPFYKKPAVGVAGCQIGFILCTGLYITALWQMAASADDILYYAGWILPAWALLLSEVLFFVLAIMVYWIFTIQLPSGMALLYPLDKLSHHGWVLRLLEKCFRPFIAAGLFIAGRIFHMKGLPFSNEVEFTYSEDEIRCIVEESHRGGKLNALENMLIRNSFHFFDLLARDVMVPRSDMVVLDYNDTMEEMRTRISQAHHTCYPLCIEDKDHIIGFIHVKDFLESCLGGDVNVKRIVRDILMVPEVMPAASLLQLMRSRRIYLAVVLDEYGGTVGMVSLEDLVEELVGEIPQNLDAEPAEITKKTDGTYEFDGTVILDNVSDLLQIDFESVDAATIGGYVFALLERIPQVGDSIVVDHWKFTVLRMEGFRITRLKAEPVKEDGAKPNGEEDTPS